MLPVIVDLHAILFTFLTSQVCLDELFTLSTTEDHSCGCPGDQLTFECSLTNGIATVWLGSAFDCSSTSQMIASDEIFLRHTKFISEGQASGECNDRNIVAWSISGRINGSFISQLNVTLTSDMNNKTIECVKQDIQGNRTSVGMSTVFVPTDFTSSFSTSINLADVSRNQLLFSWSKDINSMSLNLCSSFYNYVIRSENCGNCPQRTSNTSALCTIPASYYYDRSTVCTFSVQSCVCGEVECESAQSLKNISTVPSPPEIQGYYHNVPEFGIIVVIVTFTYNESQKFNISDDIQFDGSPISYTIVYSDSTSGATCFSNKTSASTCDKGVCNYTLDTETIYCSCINTMLNVSIFATNILGDGPLTEPFTINIDTPFYRSAGCDNTMRTITDLSSSVGKTPTFNVATVAVIVVIIGFLVVIILTAVTVLVLFPARLKLLSVFSKRIPESFRKSTDTPQSQAQTTIEQDIPLTESTIYADVSTKAMSTTCTMSLTALDDKVEYAELEYAELNYSADTTSHATRSTSMCPIRSNVNCTDDRNSTHEQTSLDQVVQNQGLVIYADVCPKAKSTTVHSTQHATLDDKVEYAVLKHSAVGKRSASMSTTRCVVSLDNNIESDDQKHLTGIDDDINLDILLIQLRPQATSKWYHFGLAIGINKETMDAYSSHPDEECLVEVLDYWLRNHTSKPSWKEIASALKEIELDDLAETILKSYETGLLPIQVDLEDIA